MFPKISSAFNGWQQSITLIKITQTLVDYETVETKTNLFFKGIIQPLGAHILRSKPLEERAFKWLQIHVFNSVNNLNLGELIEYSNKQYRIKEILDYSLNNYIEYHAVENYQND